MKPEVIRHLRWLWPALDVRGEWLCPGNAKTAQKSMMLGVLDERQVIRARGWRNWRRVWDQIIVPGIDDVFMFTFVRNPWDRAVSVFHFLQQRVVRQEERIAPHWQFQDYVKQVLAVRGVGINQHWRLQLPTFRYNGGEIPGMYVGRFERLQEDWSYIANQLGVSQKIPHFNPSKHKPYTDYYDEEAKEIIGRLYAKEIKLLSYEFAP